MGVFKRTIKGKDGKKKERWYIDYVLDGKRKWESVGAVGEISKEQAKKLLALRKTEILQGKFNTPKQKVIPTFSEFSKEYIEFAKGNKKSWDRDMYALKRLEPFFRGNNLTGISPILIERYRLERKQRVSSRTVNIELKLLKRMFNLAIAWDKCKVANPVNRVKLLKEAPPKERILTIEEEERLIAESPSHLKPVLITAINTGMRYGELINLTWNDVDLDSGYVHVRQSKSGKARKVPMNKTVRQTLLELFSGNFVSSGSSLDIKTKDYQVVPSIKHVPVKPEVAGSSPVGPATKPTFYVFTYRDNPVKGFRTSFENACKRAGIKNLSFHALRHTFATRLVLKGVDIDSVRKLLGHSNITMTMRYFHPTPEALKKAVEVLNSPKSEKSVSNSVSSEID